MNKCKYSEYCGGCNLQGIEYSKQLELKQEKINKLLKNFGKVSPIIGMKDPNNYRNKVQVTFGYDDYHHVLCGNYVPRSHMIVPIDDCMICDEKANKIIESVKKLVNKYKVSIFDERALKGSLRHLLIRTSNTGEIMLVLVTGSSMIKNGEQFINDIIKYNPEISTIVQNINNKHTSMILGERNIVLYGKGYIIDTLLGLSFKISPQSFYQVNKRQTEILYSKAIEAANLNKNEVLLDAYCGTGTIGLLMASKAKEVIGVELNKAAIKDAINNARYNKINNVNFIGDDASNYLNKLAKNNCKLDVVVMDPPRSGSDDKFMKSLIRIGPKRIVYVSCNPLTLKENLTFLSKFYKVNSIQPVDMFPYTDHVETVVKLERKDVKSKDYIEIGIDAEDYYRIKNKGNNKS